MLLKINSNEKIIYEWEIHKVSFMTFVWEITILPWHIPLATVLKAWVIKIYPLQAEKHNLPKEMDFLFENDAIQISLWQWIAYIDWENILLLTTWLNLNSEKKQELLDKMKNQLEKQIIEAKTKWSIEEIEKSLINLQKIDADMKLLRLKSNIKY